MQSAVPKSEYCVHSDWYGPRGEVRTASKHVMGLNRPPPQTIQSGTDTFELEILPALIGYLTAVGGGFEKLYKTRLGLAWLQYPRVACVGKCTYKDLWRIYRVRIVISLLNNFEEERRNGNFQEDEILEESGEFQNGSFERDFRVLRALHKAKNEEPITGEQQQYTGKLQGDNMRTDRPSV